MKRQRLHAWNVYHQGQKIDTVFFVPGLDGETVRASLIHNDGYDAGIVVELAR